jgi:hypothetical protein
MIQILKEWIERIGKVDDFSYLDMFPALNLDHISSLINTCHDENNNLIHLFKQKIL